MRSLLVVAAVMAAFGIPSLVAATPDDATMAAMVSPDPPPTPPDRPNPPPPPPDPKF